MKNHSTPLQVILQLLLIMTYNSALAQSSSDIYRRIKSWNKLPRFYILLHIRMTKTRD
ncbi:MAG: hypothetical protein IPN36_13300 [Bacteroidetes bacterium]|nr:hypothetical protein [Bacteroidota bacterium]